MKENKGVTLVALIITIIVLLLLTGVAIATITGQNSVIENANKAVELAKQDEAKDQEIINKVDEMFKKYIKEEKVLLEISGTGINETRTFTIPDGVNVIKITLANDMTARNLTMSLKNNVTENDIQYNAVGNYGDTRTIYVKTTPGVTYDIQVGITNGKVIIEYSNEINNQTPNYDLAS